MFRNLEPRSNATNHQPRLTYCEELCDIQPYYAIIHVLQDEEVVFASFGGELDWSGFDLRSIDLLFSDDSAPACSSFQLKWALGGSAPQQLFQGPEA